LTLAAAKVATIDYTIGFTKAEVEEILSIHKTELTKTLASWSDSGSSASKRRIDEIHTVIAACQSALRKLAPATYAPSARIGQSRVAFVDR
jgi:hypothetical protein